MPNRGLMMSENEMLRALRWWSTIATIIEREPPEKQFAFRCRLNCMDLLESAKAVKSKFGGSWTRERIRQIEVNITKKLIDAMTPPA